MNAAKRLQLYLVVLFVLTIVLRAILIFYFNNNLGGIEPNVIYGIQRILLGQHLYQDPSTGSLAVIQYTPLYYHTVACIVKLISADSFDHGLNVQGIYEVCRTLALCLNLLTVIICSLIIRSCGFSRKQAFAFSMPVLIMLTSHYYTRGDSMQLLFFTCAAGCYILFSRSKNLVLLIAAALFSACSLMVKQSGILVIGIIGFCLLFIERKMLGAMVYTICTGLFTVAIAGALISNSEWIAFYQNAYLGLKNGIDLSFLYQIFLSQFFMDMVPCYFVGLIIVRASLKNITDNTFRILAAGAALSWAFGTVTGLKIGSSNNYYMEFLLFVFMALPALMRESYSSKILFTIKKRTVSVRGFAAAALFILMTSKTMGLFSGIFIERSIKNTRAEYAREQQLYNYFKQQMHLTSGKHVYFTERRFLDNLFAEYAVAATKDVIAQVYSAGSNTYNYSGFVNGMNTGLVDYIVTDEKKDDINIYQKEIPFIHFDKDRFREVARAYGYVIYAYTPAAS